MIKNVKAAMGVLQKQSPRNDALCCIAKYTPTHREKAAEILLKQNPSDYKKMIKR